MDLKSLIKGGIFIQAGKHGLFPGFIYLICFTLLTYPLILNLETHFFTSDRDGLMEIWNLWWVNRVVTHPGIYSSIWQTDMLQWPFGVTLLGHTLTPINGFFATFLLRFMSLLEAHNLIVIFSFVASGLTAYWLALYFTESPWWSLAAGYIFTFSAYHFAHYDGHLNLITLEWIPIFALCFHRMVFKPGVWMGLAAGVSLWLVMLSDLYYLFYCLLFGGLIVLFRMIEERNFLFFTGSEYAAPLGVFGLLALVLIGPVVFPLIYLSIKDPFLGIHDPAEFSLDLYSIFIPGARWRFGALTGFFWQNLKGEPAEINVFPGWSVLILIGYLIVARKNLDAEVNRQARLWLTVGGFFLLMAFGPRLQIGGQLTGLPMPYAVLESVLPIVKLSGVPVRMIILAMLAGSVLAAFSLKELSHRFPRRKALIFAILFLVIVESLPAPLTSTALETPSYVEFLAELPQEGGVLDLATPTQYLHLYYQTIHAKPLVFGYTARIPSRLYKMDREIKNVISDQDFKKLSDVYRIRYIVTNEAIEVYDPSLDIQLIYDEEGVKIYRLAIR